MIFLKIQGRATLCFKFQSWCLKLRLIYAYSSFSGSNSCLITRKHKTKNCIDFRDLGEQKLNWLKSDRQMSFFRMMWFLQWELFCVYKVGVCRYLTIPVEFSFIVVCAFSDPAAVYTWPLGRWNFYYFKPFRRKTDTNSVLVSRNMISSCSNCFP